MSITTNEATLKTLKAERKSLDGQIKLLERVIFKQKLPEDGIILDEGLGERYPMSSGYYGIIVSERPAMHIYQDKIYGIEIWQYKEDSVDIKIGYVSTKHGNF